MLQQHGGRRRGGRGLWQAEQPQLHAVCRHGGMVLDREAHLAHETLEGIARLDDDRAARPARPASSDAFWNFTFETMGDVDVGANVDRGAENKQEEKKRPHLCRWAGTYGVRGSSDFDEVGLIL